MKHLVTGGAGFLGSHMVDLLLGCGDSVVVLDDFSTGHHWEVGTQTRRLGVVRGDVRAPFYYSVDRVWHLACPASPPEYQRDAVGTVRTAVEGTLNALRCAREVGARLLIASTSEVYGDPEPAECPLREGYWGRVNPVGPRSMYDEGKRCAEALAVAWAAQYGTDVRIARIFNTYGPRMEEGDGRMLPNFIGQALRGEPLTVYGDGMQTRSLCYVDDLVGGLVRLMNYETFGTSSPVVNLGNPDERTVLSVADAVRAWYLGATKKEAPEVRFLPALRDDPRRRCPDIRRARERLSWSPSTRFEDGLRKTAAWFRDRMGQKR